MKKSIGLLGCAVLGVLAACSTESASKSEAQSAAAPEKAAVKPANSALAAAAEAAVITPSDPLTPQLEQQFARELRILKDNNMKRETIKDADGSMWYCQGVYNEDQPGKPAILIFLHGIGERGDNNLAQNELGVSDIVKNIRDQKQKVVLITCQCPSSELWAPLHRGGDSDLRRRRPGAGPRPEEHGDQHFPRRP